MNENIKFNLKNFQSDIFKRYKSLIRDANEAVLFAEKGFAGFNNNSNLGFIRRNVKKIILASKIKFHNFYVRSEAFTEIEKKADEIIDNPEIKKIFCPIIKRRISKDFFKEELEAELIIIVTDSLIKRNMTKKFSIERDVLLFSIIIRKILSQGIENYCRN